MKSLLVLAPHPQFVEDVRVVVEPLGFRVVHRLTVEEAEPLLLHGLVSVCLLDLEGADVQGVWMVERIVRRAPQCAIVAFSGDRQPQWEEELYLAGVRQVFTKPLRPRLLVQALTHLTQDQGATSPAIGSVAGTLMHQVHPAEANRSDDQGLGVLCRFSEILTHSLDAAALVRQFLHLLREMVGVNRSAIFVRTDGRGSASGESDGASGWMKPLYAVGLSSSLADHALLSRESGVGASLLRSGRILRRQDYDVDPVTRRELEMIGAEVAIPIMGRDEMVGVAFLDNRVTGQPLGNGELESIFHLLEQVGVALGNIRAHDQLVGSNQLLGNVLRELSNACLVVGPDLTVIHSNQAANRVIGGVGRRSGKLHFTDLPEVLGAKLYQVVKTGAAVPSFRYQADDASKSVYHVSVAPLPFPGGRAETRGNSALMVMEDRTQAEQLQQLELEAANLRLVSTMADRLAAEIGNAIVPLSVHYQLFDERIKEPEFRKTLKTALGDGVKRVDRLANQMRFLYGNARSEIELIPLGQLLDEADREAKQYFAVKNADLECSSEVRSTTISCHRDALKHSFSEIILNGYQAHSENPRVEVRLAAGAAGNGAHEIGIEFQDAGEGFSEEAVKRATQPFYTERSVGVGLGLSAALKIIEVHGGRMEIPPGQQGKHGLVRVFLPVKQAQE
jgi:nitrogen-specific signal transduction histidine kinase/DNA-binding NarL/FixJ family response regulator